MNNQMAAWLIISHSVFALVTPSGSV